MISQICLQGLRKQVFFVPKSAFLINEIIADCSKLLHTFTKYSSRGDGPVGLVDDK